jgi:endonuclease YncB( thermonuclease family)
VKWVFSLSLAALAYSLFVGPSGPPIVTAPAVSPTRTASQVERDTTFTCTPTHVWDGDGPIWCAEGPRVRLSGIATREIAIVSGQPRDGGCNDGHPCPTMSGPQAREVLVSLLGDATGTGVHGHTLVKGPAIRCEAVGTTYSRIAAFCTLADGRDLSCAMVQAGAAFRWARYDPRGRLSRC